jgi:hypothetical protein
MSAVIHTCCDASGTSGLPCSLFLYVLALGAFSTLCINVDTPTIRQLLRESQGLENMPAVICVRSVMFFALQAALQPGQVAIMCATFTRWG